MERAKRNQGYGQKTQEREKSLQEQKVSSKERIAKKGALASKTLNKEQKRATFKSDS